MRLFTEEEVTELYFNFEGELENAWDVSMRIKEKLGAWADIVTVSKGKGRTERVFILRFKMDKAEPEKIARIAKNIVEKDIWVDIRYRAKIGLRKGEEWFRDEDEFVEELLS